MGQLGGAYNLGGLPTTSSRNPSALESKIHQASHPSSDRHAETIVAQRRDAGAPPLAPARITSDNRNGDRNKVNVEAVVGQGAVRSRWIVGAVSPTGHYIYLDDALGCAPPPATRYTGEQTCSRCVGCVVSNRFECQASPHCAPNSGWKR